MPSFSGSCFGTTNTASHTHTLSIGGSGGSGGVGLINGPINYTTSINSSMYYDPPRCSIHGVIMSSDGSCPIENIQTNQNTEITLIKADIIALNLKLDALMEIIKDERKASMDHSQSGGATGAHSTSEQSSVTGDGWQRGTTD